MQLFRQVTDDDIAVLANVVLDRGIRVTYRTLVRNEHIDINIQIVPYPMSVYMKITSYLSCAVPEPLSTEFQIF